MDRLQAEIEKIEGEIYDCEAIIEGKGTGLSEDKREDASRRKPGLEQERETKVLERAAKLNELFNNALKAVKPICDKDKELRRHLQD